MPKSDPMQRTLWVLKLLWCESNADRRMSAREIAAILKEREGVTVDPRSIRGYLNSLIEGGFPIEGTGKYYYRGVFTPGEAEYLSLAIRYGTGLVPEQRESMLKKLILVAGRDAGMKGEIPDPGTAGNPEMLKTIALLRSAMALGKQVSFRYCDYDIGAVMKMRTCRKEKPKLYNASPYRLLFANGRYYLLAAVNRHREVSAYRIDRITEAALRRARIRPAAEPIGARFPLEHPYLYPGPVFTWRLRVRRRDLNDIFDWFGTDTICERTDDRETDVLVRSDAASMDLWLARYRRIVRSAERLDG